MDTLSTIFGSEARVRIMRLFLFNGEVIFDVDTVSSKSKVDREKVKKEVTILEKIKFIKKRRA